jgi:zinc transporter, ZIP family
MVAEPLSVVVMFSSLAALAAGLGVLPQALRGDPAPDAIAWGHALAAGLMLGVAYTLLTTGMGDALAAGGSGALLGIGFVRLTHHLTGTAELDLLETGGDAGSHHHRTLLRDTIHAAHEGVAIGVAMTVSLPVGVTMAVALAAHNIPEAMSLTAILSRRTSLPRAAAWVLATNLNQVLFAAAAFLALGTMPALRPAVAGFAAAALAYLVLSELLPQAYRHAGHTSIALVTLVAMGVLVLLAPTPA